MDELWTTPLGRSIFHILYTCSGPDTFCRIDHCMHFTLAAHDINFSTLLISTCRDSWERGQPDYEGAASFDNILKKVDRKHIIAGIFCYILPNPLRSTKQWASEDLPPCLLQLPTTMMPPIVWYQKGGLAYSPPTPISLFQFTTWWFNNTCNVNRYQY